MVNRVESNQFIVAARSAVAGVERYPRLRVAVILIWTLFLGFALYAAFEDERFVGSACAIAIATSALLPGYLWADGRVPGLPVLPLHTLTLLWTYGLPLVAGHPEIQGYYDEDIGFSTVCVVIYALVATALWLLVANLPGSHGARYLTLPKGRGFAFFTGSIFAGALFITAALSGLIVLDPGLYGILRSTVLAFASIAVFVLSLRYGRGDLNATQRILFLGAVTLFVVIQLGSLYLVGSIVTLASALIGFTIGRGRVPWFTIVLVVLIFGFLHNGKTQMRERYWEGEQTAIPVWNLPVFFAEWIAAGAREIGAGREGLGSAPIYERVSLMHLLLLAQRSAPDSVPYLEGETYVIVPRLLVPRIFDPDKPDSHRGTAILNQQFGLQSLEDTQSTTVGWGLLNEGYANFGLGGVAGVAAFLGLLFGFVGRLSAGAPVMSLSGMVGITFCALAIQSEFTMGVFATVMLQSIVVLFMIVPLLERRRAVDAD